MDKYEIGQDIGQGAFGQVFLALDKSVATSNGKGGAADEAPLPVHVAIKRLKDPVQDWEALRGLREVMAVHTLRQKEHPNIVATKEVHWDDETKLVSLVFEYMPDGNLHGLLCQYGDQGKLLEEDLIQSLVQQTLRGLRHCHNCGIQHRDVKPENLLLHRKGKEWICKLADFSLARRAPRGRVHGFGESMVPPDECTSYVSTRWYRAPEVLLCDRMYSFPVDIYAMGCILAEMYELSALFPGDSEMDQLKLIFQFLGAPHESTWPEGMELARRKGLDLSAASPQGALQDLLLYLEDGCTSVDTAAAAASPHAAVTQGIQADVTPPSRNPVITPPSSSTNRSNSNIIPRLSGSLQDQPVSEFALEFFQGLIELNPQKRLTASEALAHPYCAEPRGEPRKRLFRGQATATKRYQPTVTNPSPRGSSRPMQKAPVVTAYKTSSLAGQGPSPGTGQIPSDRQVLAPLPSQTRNSADNWSTKKHLFTRICSASPAEVAYSQGAKRFASPAAFSFRSPTENEDTEALLDSFF